MTISFKDARDRLVDAQILLGQQDIKVLPTKAKIRLLEAQRCIYQELQMLEVARINSHLDEYSVHSQALAESEADFRDMHRWAEEAEKTGQAVSNLFKGLSLVLSLL